MLLERRELLELLADGDRLAHLDGDEWVFEGTRKRCATDLMSRLIPEHVNYAGVMRAPDDYSIAFWITEEGKAALDAGSQRAA